MVFTVKVHKKAEGSLTKLYRSGEGNTADKIIESLERITEDPYQPRPGADILQLKSVDPKLYRLRVGKYRILYSIDNKRKVVNVTMILHRKQAYR